MHNKVFDQAFLTSPVDLRECIHKLNNLVTVIQGNAQLIKLESQSKEDAEEILSACGQMRDVLSAIRQTI